MMFIVQIDNKTKSTYNRYIVKNDKNKKTAKETRAKKPQKMRKKNVAKAAEWGKRWEKERKLVSQKSKKNRFLR